MKCFVINLRTVTDVGFGKMEKSDALRMSQHKRELK